MEVHLLTAKSTPSKWKENLMKHHFKQISNKVMVVLTFGLGLYLCKTAVIYHFALNWTATSGKAPSRVSTILHLWISFMTLLSISFILPVSLRGPHALSVGTWCYRHTLQHSLRALRHSILCCLLRPWCSRQRDRPFAQLWSSGCAGRRWSGAHPSIELQLRISITVLQMTQHFIWQCPAVYFLEMARSTF